MLRTHFFKINNNPIHAIISRRNKSTNSVEKAADSYEEALSMENNLQREEEIERKRNKSKLSKSDYRKLHGQVPYDEPCHWTHSTLRYQRKLYGVYGSASPIDPRICWMDKSELESKLEYNSLAEDRTIPDMIAEIKERKRLEKEAILERDREVARNVAKIDGWKRELQAKIKKKFDEAETAKARKEKLIEEVRRHFGFTVDPKDERFKEMVEKKEKEQKKADKLAKKSAREAKMLEMLKQETAQLAKPELSISEASKYQKIENSKEESKKNEKASTEAKPTKE